MQIGEYNEDTVRAYRFDEDRKHIFVKLWLNAEDSEPDKFSKGGCLSISGSRAAADLSTMKHCGPTRPAESQALQLKQVSPWESRTLKPENYWRKHKTADKLCTALCRPGWSKSTCLENPVFPKWSHHMAMRIYQVRVKFMVIHLQSILVYEVLRVQISQNSWLQTSTKQELQKYKKVYS